MGLLCFIQKLIEDDCDDIKTRKGGNLPKELSLNYNLISAIVLRKRRRRFLNRHRLENNKKKYRGSEIRK